MITAMTELIEAINLITKKYKRGLSTEEILDMCNNQLDKEKEQIENAFFMGRDDVTRKFVNSSKEYYNQTYKQYGLDEEARELLNNYKGGHPEMKEI